jgi:hypothetical protein
MNSTLQLYTERGKVFYDTITLYTDWLADLEEERGKKQKMLEKEQKRFTSPPIQFRLDRGLLEGI